MFIATTTSWKCCWLFLLQGSMVTNCSGPGGGRFSVVSSHSKGKSRAFLASRRDRRKGFGAALPIPTVCGEDATSRVDWFPGHILPINFALSTTGGLWLVYLVYRLQERFQALVSVYGSWMLLIPAVGRAEHVQRSPLPKYLSPLHGPEKKKQCTLPGIWSGLRRTQATLWHPSTAHVDTATKD